MEIFSWTLIVSLNAQLENMGRFRRVYAKIVALCVAHVPVRMQTPANLAILDFSFRELQLDQITAVGKHVRRVPMQKFRQEHVKNVWISASLVQIVIHAIHGKKKIF
jgi:hypothetical protein